MDVVIPLVVWGILTTTGVLFCQASPQWKFDDRGFTASPQSCHAWMGYKALCSLIGTLEHCGHSSHTCMCMLHLSTCMHGTVAGSVAQKTWRGFYNYRSASVVF